MPAPYLNRELSWLEFNQRVLNEALRDDLPLLERVKFLAITASNLDEFFQVRVGGFMVMLRGGLKTPDPSGLTPSRNLAAMRQRVLKMMESQYDLFSRILVPALHKAGIHLLEIADLTVEQSAQVAATFEDLIHPLLTPVAVVPGEPFPVVPALQVIVACRLVDPETQTTRHAFIPIPESLGRRVPVATGNDGTHAFLVIEDLVATHAARLFPGETVAATTAFRVTRNGDLALMIQNVTASDKREIYQVNGPPGLASFMELSFLADYEHLRAPDWPGQNSPAIAPGASMFDTIASGDVMLFHPFESFEPVLSLLEEAAVDPDVVAIKQVLYRTARKSSIIDALIKAAENGKHVTVLVELKARFDEARNLDRADELQRAGAQIVYGVKGLKTHAKVCMIVRRESGHLRRYVHLGTGNYNETTSKLYTDVSYLTCKPEYGNDASLLFNAVSGRSKLLRFQRLIPAPTTMKHDLIDLITGEAERAKQGLPARIIAKMNSLQDPDIINALYSASRAGVEIKLNVRGICCLKPGDPKYSKNIEVISIIDRFLEHARLLYFHQGGDSKVYLSSADWMTRNMEKRVELMVPIEEVRLKRRIMRILDGYFQDNTQASRLLPDGSSQRVVKAKGQKSFRAQEYFYQQAKKAAKAREHERAMTFEPHVPAE